MSLQDRLDAFKADFENGKLPFKPTAQQLEAMHRATAELITSGQAGRALKAADKAPDFVLNDPDGKPVSSRDLLAKGPLVVSFYRGVWCPYCNLELQALQAALPAIEERGANVIAISPQTAPSSCRSQRDNKLGFPILSDVKAQVANAFGIRFALPDYLVEVDKGFKNDCRRSTTTVTGSADAGRDVIGTRHHRDAEINPDHTSVRSGGAVAGARSMRAGKAAKG